MDKRYRIYLVEDHEIFRMGLKELIDSEDDLCVCGETGGATDAWKDINTLRPDMAVIDLSLSEGNGLQLIKDLCRRDRSLPILVLSMYDEGIYAERSLASGARGYIMKQETSESIVKAIRRILGGEIYVSEKITSAVLSRLSGPPGCTGKTPLSELTDRELEVFELIGKGLSSGEIAKRLNLNVKTIGTYRERIKEKLGIKNASDLIKNAALWVEGISRP